MIQKVVKRHPVGELVITINDMDYLIKVVTGGNRLRADGIKTNPTAMFAMLVSEDFNEQQLFALPFSGHPEDVMIFKFEIDTAIIKVVCDVDMSVTVKSK